MDSQLSDVAISADIDVAIAVTSRKHKQRVSVCKCSTPAFRMCLTNVNVNVNVNSNVSINGTVNDTIDPVVTAVFSVALAFCHSKPWISWKWHVQRSYHPINTINLFARLLHICRRC